MPLTSITITSPNNVLGSGVVSANVAYTVDGNVPTSTLSFQASTDNGTTWNTLDTQTLNTAGGDGDEPVTWTFTPLAPGTYDFRVEGQGFNPGGNPVNAPVFSGTAEDVVVCFLAGTLIATPDGEVVVEALAIGDLVLTADGRAVPVKWIGRQRIRNLMFLHSPKMEPVCIAAGALGQGLPHTDLYVSAAHGMVWQDLVVNAGAMVNGTTIRFVPLAEMPDEFTWYHIETEAHEEVLANGAPSETFVDYVGRSLFDNHQEYLDLYGAERIIPEMKRPRLSAQRMLPNHLRALLDIAPYGVEIKAEHEALMQRLNAA